MEEQFTQVPPTITKKLKELDLIMPEASIAGGNYHSANIRGNQAFISMQFPIYNGKYLYRGILGEDMTTKEGYEAAQLAALNILAQIHHKIGIDQLAGINHLDIYYKAAEDWDESLEVANGASDLMVHALGESGTHSRSVVGVYSLPRHFSVGVSACCTLRNS